MPKVHNTRQTWDWNSSAHGRPRPIPGTATLQSPSCLGMVSGEQTSFRGASASHLPNKPVPMEAEALSWEGAGLQQGDLTPASARCELLEVLTQVPPAQVPRSTLQKGAGTESSRQTQCPARAYLATWQTECISLRRTPHSQVSLHKAQPTPPHLAALSGRSGKEGGGSWTSLMASRHQHGALTKPALSAVIHPHPLRLAHSAACEQGPVCNTQPSSPLPGQEQRPCHQPTFRSQVHVCNGICWLPGASPGDKVAPRGKGAAGKASETALWCHTGVGLNPSSATDQLGDL